MDGRETVSVRFAIGLGLSSRATLDDVVRLLESCAAELLPRAPRVMPAPVSGEPALVLGDYDVVLATVDRRAEPAQAVAGKLGLPLQLFSAATLTEVEGVTHHSTLAQEKTGTPSVAEAAALAALGPGAQLIQPRRIGNGCTCAVAVLV